MNRKGRYNRLWLGLGLAAGALTGLYLWRRRAEQQLPPLFEAWDETGRDEARVALITGASSGIGATYARRLAREGYHLILVARREERLQALAEELQQQDGVGVEVLVADLSDPAGIKTVEQRIAQVDVLDILVNNAGFGTRGKFAEVDVEGQADMVRVHVLAAVRFTRAALPRMIARGRGAIVNVSSLIAFLPLPGNATYTATKTYLSAFTETLHQELAGTGVRVQALCPGFTRTEFHQAGKMDTSSIPSFMWMSAERVVEHSLRDLQRGQVISIPGLGYRLMAWVSRLIPRRLLYGMMGKFQHLRASRSGRAGKGRQAFGGYPKRTYGSVGEMLADFRFMARNQHKVRYAMRLIDPAFNKRLILAVTQVNGCRYCAHHHAKAALKGGMSQEEVDALLSGTVEQCPPEEVTAVLYAQHWADTAGHPDPEARQTLVETYGADKAEAIETLLHMIKAGNYIGNTFDYVLYRISGGRWGV